MKISKDGLFWIKQTEQGHYDIGVTERFHRQYGDVFVVLPRATRGGMVQGKPFVNVETCNCIRPLHSPFTAETVRINQEVLDFPERLVLGATLAFAAGVKDAENI